MNNEIKEILDYLKIENGTIGSELSYEETHLLLDYITNLQQENERLKEYYNIIVKFNEKNIDRYCDYYSRCEKAIEYINTHKVSDTITFPLMKREQENQVKSCFDYEFEQAYKKDLLNILQNGSDSQ